jgi:sec-independent protein translocase protein TatC
MQPAIYSHILEIRSRIFYLLCSFILTYLTCYMFSFELIYLFVRPFLKYETNFIFTDVTEVFSSTLYVCFIVTILITIPLLVYQTWCFFIPSYYTNERKTLSIYCLFFSFAVLCSFFFIYLFLLPKIYYFFLNFEIQDKLLTIHLSARIYCYMQLTIKIFCILQILLNIPFFIFLLFEWKLFSVFSAARNRKYILMICVLVASIVSPPEILTELLIALFFFFFFEIIIWFVFFREVWKENFK